MRTFRSRLADFLVLILGLVSVLAVAEMAVRPFYAAPPEIKPPQVAFEYSSRLGWEMVPDLHAHTLDQEAPVNLKRLRGDLVSYEKPDSLRRWLVLGGGSAFGVGVAGEETFAERAAEIEGVRLDTPIQVIDGGCEGYDLFQSLRFLEMEGRLYRPDAIVLLFEARDLPSTGVRDSSFSRPRFLRAAQVLNRVPDATPSAYEKLRRWSRLVHFIDSRTRAFLRLGRNVAGPEPSFFSGDVVRSIDLLLGRDSAPVEAAWRSVEAEFNRIGQISSDIHATVFVVGLPLPPQLRRTYSRARYQSRLAAICTERHFVWVDPLEPMRAARRDILKLYLPRLPYLNFQGHRVVGDVLAHAVEASMAMESAPAMMPTGESRGAGSGQTSGGVGQERTD